MKTGTLALACFALCSLFCAVAVAQRPRKRVGWFFIAGGVVFLLAAISFEIAGLQH